VLRVSALQIAVGVMAQVAHAKRAMATLKEIFLGLHGVSSGYSPSGIISNLHASSQSTIMNQSS
jgi:hypothetical protein